MCLRALEGYAITYYPSALRYFFEIAPAWIRNAISDPAGIGYNPNVGKYLDTPDKINEVISRLNTACTRAKKAEEYASRDKDRKSVV